MHIYLLKKITKPVVTWISELFKENVLELNGSNIKLRRVKFRTFAEIIVAGHHDAMVTLRKQYRFVLVNKSSEVVKKIPIARIWLQLSFFRTEIELKVTDFAEVSQFLPCNKPYKRSIREAQKQIKSMIMKEKFLAEI